MVTDADFEHGLQYDVKPAFGISEEQLDRYVFNGSCKYMFVCKVEPPIRDDLSTCSNPMLIH